MCRDFVDFNRVNLQHYIWKDIFGYSLHPKIPRDGKSLKIAYVGTGTGIWLLDLAPQLDESAELFGLDVDVTQAGPKEWLPNNFSLRKWGVFAEVPDDLVAPFDIVHLRFFAFVIEDDPTPVVGNLIKLLKPGGYIQWGDIDAQSMQLLTSLPDIPADKLAALWKATIPIDSRVFPGWCRDLAQIFQSHGLQEVEADWQIGKRQSSMAMHWCNLSVHEMIGGRLRLKNPQRASEIAALVQAAAVQTQKGAMFMYDRVNVLGRKPKA
ncbi:uncharacterized protein F4822DRAFT_435255 [Hypoxylon trugodes]|uniref:uncharacterized protein n=1 Tax=Hypoxylon trugodes TaxID=326681 RepID=UPI00218DC50A|nr:uncharacterized protein F4822DRAFT_435255 [Hypoxylon trugodes]KAI1382879.1 hypothetical protein F4822DRAFT_435255 [Hypoxylon trugodes]